MKTLLLTILAHEGPILRAYLATMRRAGLRAERMLLMVKSRHPATRKPVGRWLPGRVRTWYAEKVQEYAENYWPRRIRSSRPDLVEAMTRGMAPLCDDAADIVADMLAPVRYEDYAERVERILVTGVRDPILPDWLSADGRGWILYTGGGILPASLLEIPGVRFLHVHPGHLPHVRGADGLLWSMLVRGKPGAACFVMDPGIDTGDIVTTRDYPALTFDIPSRPRPDDQTLYRAVFSYYDPILRARLLVDEVLGNGSDFPDLSAAPQDRGEGVTYHFMQPAQRRTALDTIFVSGGHPSPQRVN